MQFTSEFPAEFWEDESDGFESKVAVWFGNSLQEVGARRHLRAKWAEQVEKLFMKDLQGLLESGSVCEWGSAEYYARIDPVTVLDPMSITEGECDTKEETEGWLHALLVFREEFQVNEPFTIVGIWSDGLEVSGLIGFKKSTPDEPIVLFG